MYGTSMYIRTFTKKSPNKKLFSKLEMLHQDPFDFCPKNPPVFGEFLFGINLAGLEVPDNSRPLGSPIWRGEYLTNTWKK